MQLRQAVLRGPHCHCHLPDQRILPSSSKVVSNRSQALPNGMGNLHHNHLGRQSQGAREVIRRARAKARTALVRAPGRLAHSVGDWVSPNSHQTIRRNADHFNAVNAQGTAAKFMRVGCATALTETNVVRGNPVSKVTQPDALRTYLRTRQLLPPESQLQRQLRHQL